MNISEALNEANGRAICRPFGEHHEKLVIQEDGLFFKCGIKLWDGRIRMHKNWTPQAVDLKASDWEVVNQEETSIR